MLTLLAASLAQAAASVPAEKEAVLEVVDRFFEAYFERDGEAAAETLAAGAVGRGVIIEDGEPSGITAPIDMSEWADKLPDLKTRNAELYWSPKVEITDGLAQFWAPYVIEVDGERSHCGIDAFTLIKVEGRWKLDGMQFTMDADSCDDLGYAPGMSGLRPASLRAELREGSR